MAKDGTSMNSTKVYQVPQSLTAQWLSECQTCSSAVTHCAVTFWVPNMQFDAESQPSLSCAQKIGASSEHVVPIRHTKELHQSRGILAGSPHIHAKVVLQEPVLPYMFIINWTCPTTYYFLPQIGMANMRIPPKSAELLRSPESAICVCRCMATCQNLCYKTWVGHDFRKTWCGCLVCWASHVYDPSHALSPNIYAPPKIRNHVNISDTPL